MLYYMPMHLGISTQKTIYGGMHIMFGQILLQLLLIGLNAIFACAEIAIISIHDTKLQHMAAGGDKRAARLVKLTSQPARFLATIQVAITLSGFLGSAFAADNFSATLTNWLLSLGVPLQEETLDTLSVLLITILLSYLTLVFGELVPKRIGMKNAEKLGLALSTMISVISKLFRPLVSVLTASTNGILRLFGMDPNAEAESVTEEEIRMMVDAGSEKGAIDDIERELIQNVFAFDDITAEDICTHRTDTVFLSREDTPEQWHRQIFETCHNYYPVCGASSDQIIGVLSAVDYYRLENKTRDAILAAIRPAYFVPAAMTADVLFTEMKRNHERFAVVLDEYGGTAGVITMTDLIEELVGDLGHDTNPSADEELTRINDTTWRIGGGVRLSEVSAAIGITLTGDYDTLSGYLFGALGSIPKDGSHLKLQTEQINAEVLNVRGHKAETVLVSLRSAKSAETAPSAQE